MVVILEIIFIHYYKGGPKGILWTSRLGPLNNYKRIGVIAVSHCLGLE